MHYLQNLRSRIRQSGTQFRRDDDNSPSLFNPEEGFIFGYDIAEVEAALDEFEHSQPAVPLSTGRSMEDEILRDASLLCETHPDMEIRDFARTVLAYMALTCGKRPTTPELKAVKSANPQ